MPLDITHNTIHVALFRIAKGNDKWLVRIIMKTVQPKKTV